MHHEVDVLPAHAHPQRVQLGEVTGEPRPQALGVGRVEQLVEGATGDRAAEQVRGAGGGDDHREIGLADRQQRAVRLHRTGDGDRLVGAAGQRLLVAGGRLAGRGARHRGDVTWRRG
ncbi:hypothetical protein SAMN04515665_11579 [Blastococcus sp. DSM 46786]|nr:hypothetical protein SAMN04515665_11579 [Blastococcus sp. DSM 46786]